MTRNQEDYLSMSQTTISYLQENTAVWQDNQPLSDVVKDIDNNNDAIIDLQADQEKSHKGITNEKQEDRTDLEDAVHLVANALAFFALRTKNKNVEEEVDKGTVDLSRLSGVKLLGVADVVLETGTENLAAAKGYGLTQQMLDDLSTAKGSFTKNLNAPRAAINSAATATDMLADGIDNLHTDFKVLDKGMVQYKKNVSFYNGYYKARAIVHSPTRHLAMTANFTDAAGSPLQNVKITTSNGEEKVLRKSSPLGNIRVQNLLEGEHILTAEKPGFETQEIKFIIASPETVQLTVVMK